ncbi:hypothetical protein KUTeg_016069 [Tegillarca granosa]|uniref:NadR/Ttd14 AAA domain-containing protein n=1 Tax=Tegillarca granosa TaxID=220873 RepID=A0ABQ9EJS1_TEGGR|nr:hypothetical protein KUTeg_016069 [Tegillarca granosa]
METLRIYICGAHSTGKTTLLNDLKQHLNIYFVEEIARSIIREHSWRREDFLPDVHPDTFKQLNKEILQAQVNIESENSVRGKGKGLDPIVYVEYYIGKESEEEMYQVNGVKEWLKRMKTAMVFVLYPHIECISDDEVRLPPTIEDLNQFTQRLENLLNKHEIMYHKIIDLDRNKRVDCILQIIKQYRPELVMKNADTL